jgi:iron complex transport system substrate-binding protein
VRLPASVVICLFPALIVLCLLFGCDSKPPPTPTVATSDTKTGSANGFPRTVTDARGKQLTLNGPPRHIVSLMPSNTEILYAVGMGDSLVMDTTACDYPPAAKKKAHFNAIGSSIEPILAQTPDLVIADEKYNDRLIAALDKANVPMLVVGIHNVAQIYDAIRLIGQATGADANATKLVADMQAQIEKVRGTTATATRKPTVLLMYDANPIYTEGPDSFISEAISIAGGVNVVNEPPRGNIISSEKVVELQPDVIIASDDVQQAALKMPGWADAVPAVQNRRFYKPDPSLLRPTTRLPQAVEHLARFLHPELSL